MTLDELNSIGPFLFLHILLDLYLTAELLQSQTMKVFCVYEVIKLLLIN